MNLIAIDYGEKRVGIAKGNTEIKLALPFIILENKNNDFIISKIKEIIKEEDVSQVIIGVPVNAMGEDTKQTNKIFDFIKLLEKEINIPIINFDERFTSRQANSLFESKEKKRIDDVAAMIMLQCYFDKK